MEDCISHSALFLRSLIAARAAPGRGGRHVAGRAGGGGGNTAWIRVSVGEQPARGCPPLRGMCGGAPTASCLRFGDRMVLEGNLKCLPPPFPPARGAMGRDRRFVRHHLESRARGRVSAPHPPPFRAGAMGRGQGSAHVLGPCLWRCLLTVIKAVGKAISTLI